ALVANAKQQGLSVAIFPRLNPYAITQSLQDSPELINAWLSQYRHFITDMAIRSAQSQIHTLILGGPEIEPFLDGQDDFWNELVLTLRQKFSGQLVWAVPENRIASLPDWVTQMDALYILVSSPFEDRNLNEEAITEAFSNYLDTHLFPLYQQTGKPIWLGLDHPSAQDIQNGCVLTAEGCLPFERLIWNGSLPSSAVDLERQARFYQGAAMAINSRLWISGLVTRGYKPAVTLIDASPSIRGKPAADVIKAWYQIWTNTTSP
ncbi:glycoside hydrolase family 113, partial [Thermanaerothrix sp.]|uniref:glycoside hydrolase family 113 n=1 Tax=Thermanaerothrix sp. TaxID=2972675 RepID=UPI003C7A027F